MKSLRLKAGNYPALIEAYTRASELARSAHVPVLIHVQELTQPLGHSTSGSHERYKSETRLLWEKEYDCILTFKNWILEKKIATEDELAAIEEKATTAAKEAKTAAWKAYLAPIDEERQEAEQLVQVLIANAQDPNALAPLAIVLSKKNIAYRKPIYAAVRELLWQTRSNPTPSRKALQAWWHEKTTKHTNPVQR